MAKALREPSQFELSMMEAMAYFEEASSMADQNDALLAMLDSLAARVYPEGFDFVLLSSCTDRVNGTEGSLRYKCANTTELLGLLTRLKRWLRDETDDLS